MRLAPFPATSPWFRSSLLSDITLDELHRTVPGATLHGIAGPNRSYYKATIDGHTATGKTAPEAYRAALALLEAAV